MFCADIIKNAQENAGGELSGIRQHDSQFLKVPLSVIGRCIVFVAPHYELEWKIIDGA
jgi:hypothetical protein